MGIACLDGMRVTSDINYRLLTESIRNHQSNILSSQQRLSSGVLVSKASDDPGAYSQIRSLASSQAQMTQYQRNLGIASAYQKAVGGSLTQVTSLMQRLNEIAVKGGDGTLDDTTRGTLVDEVNELLETMVSVANGSDDGRYTFGGLRMDAPPYETVLDADGKITAVTYAGSEETREIRIGDTMTVVTNSPGSTSGNEGGVFQTSTRDVFASIIALRDALASGSEIANSGILEDLQDDLDHVLTASSLNGARQEQVTAQKNYLLNLQLSAKDARSSVESVDVAQETIKLAQAESAYEAALKSTATLLGQVSLLDYL